MVVYLIIYQTLAAIQTTATNFCQTFVAANQTTAARFLPKLRLPTKRSIFATKYGLPQVWLLPNFGLANYGQEPIRP
jgi:hypothetical protein